MADEAKKLTHWKKNIDSRYISGEDLQGSLKGLKPEMNVYISNFSDGKTFDRANQEEHVKTILFFKTVEDGASLYKGVVLNKDTAMVFKTASGGKQHVDYWVNIPIIMYAKPDKRHGFVVRFKPYRVPTEIKEEVTAIEAVTTLAELETAYKASKYPKHRCIINATNKVKNKLK